MSGSDNNIPGDKGAVFPRFWLLVLACLLGVLLGYGPALDGPLFFDDEPNLLNNSAAQIDGHHFDDWRLAIMSNDSGLLHRPLAMFTFVLNYLAAGEFTGFSLKLTNLLIHLANGLLVYWVALGLLRTPALRAMPVPDAVHRSLAVGAAALWLLHPLHVSTVLYAVQRMALLSSFFCLGGLLLFLRSRLRWAERGGGAGEVLATLLWLLILSGLGALSKENGALLPWLVVVVEVTLFQGVWQRRHRPWLERLALFFLLAPALALALLTWWVPDALPGNYSGREFTLHERLLTQGRVLWLYLQWLAVPNILQMGFFHDDIAISTSLFSPLTTVFAVIAWALLLLVCLVWRRRFPVLAFALLFYLVGHSMESTVLPLEMVFEHRNYLSSVGLAIALSITLYYLARRLSQNTPLLQYARLLGLATLLLAGLLLLRAQAWGTSDTLAKFNVMNHPESARANFYYGLSLMEQFARVKAKGDDLEREQLLAVATREHFLKMHALDGRDFAGIIMLYQFDTIHFPRLAAENDWLGRLEALASTRRLQSSDRTALGALVDFVRSTPDPAVKGRVLALVERLSDRYPWDAQLVGHVYVLQLELGRPRQDVLARLERALATNSRSLLAPAHLVGYHAREDTLATYEALQVWWRRDGLRRELPVIKELLAP